ncbi:MAG: 5-(carboxyamino)imidazole ribonucleotide synthase [Thermaerobacterales bacterium]
MSARHPVILPGSTIGILGGGQLGRMTALAARQMGYRVAVLTDDADSPAAQTADYILAGSFTDTGLIDQLAACSDVITIEFENIPNAALAWLEARLPAHPSSVILRISQNRLDEKESLQRIGVPTTAFAAVRGPGDHEEAALVTGFPAFLKTTAGGYDGKGQIYCADRSELTAADRQLAGSGTPRILEAAVPFVKELSVVVARNHTGRARTYPVIENEHRNKILHLSIAPARVPEAVARRAENLAVQIAQELSLTGVMAIEMFLTADGQILVNEMAPRPHNSGHLTLDAAYTSQFEQHVRAVCGLPLGSPGLHSAAVMLNLLGEHLAGALGRLQGILGDPGLSLHLYGKADARPGRKMGHLCALGDDAADALVRAGRAWDRVMGGSP